MHDTGSDIYYSLYPCAVQRHGFESLASSKVVCDVTKMATWRPRGRWRMKNDLDVSASYENV